MKITKIDQQKKRQNRYSVFVDDVYAFSISANDLLVTGLHSGQTLTAAEIEELESSSKESKVYEQALNYLSFRRRTVREIIDHLVGKGHDEAIVESVAQKLKAKGLVDDAAFAEAWIADRQGLKPRSRRQLEQELRRKGLDSMAVELALTAVGDVEEQAALKSIIEKKIKLSRYQDPKKLINYLITQGFRYELIKSVLADL